MGSLVRSARLGALVCCLLAVLPAAAPPCAAQTLPSPDPIRFLRWPLDDVRAVGEAGLEAALLTGATGAVVLALMPYDSLVSREAAAWRGRSNPTFVRAVEEVGNVRAARPLALMVFIGTLFTDDPHLQDAAFTSLEAVVLADLTTRALKRVFGRSRPYEGEGPHTFRPFSAATAFPSGHSTVAFALVAPWVVYYPNAWTLGLLGLSTGTAFTRILVNHHWMTDTLAGATVGTAVGVALARRHLGADTRGARFVPFGAGGAGVTLRVDF